MRKTATKVDAPTTGRDSLFRDKRHRVQGFLTDDGHTAFEAARSGLADLAMKITGTRPAAVSDADVLEYCARGYASAAAYLRTRFGK